MDDTQEKILMLLERVSRGKVSKKDERLMLTLCLTDMLEFSEDVHVQSSVKMMLEITE